MPKTLTPSQQARADAMADRDTLLLCILQSLDLGLKGEDVDVDWPLGQALYMDRRWLVRAINKGRAAEAGTRATQLAHAAFRAVPGLRG